MKIMKFATKAIHVGYEPDPRDRGYHAADLYDIHIYAQEAPGRHAKAMNIRALAIPI